MKQINSAKPGAHDQAVNIDVGFVGLGVVLDAAGLVYTNVLFHDEGWECMQDFSRRNYVCAMYMEKKKENWNENIET